MKEGSLEADHFKSVGIPFTIDLLLALPFSQLDAAADAGQPLRLRDAIMH